jgi:ferredoxin-type protein NapH
VGVDSSQIPNGHSVYAIKEFIDKFAVFEYYTIIPIPRGGVQNSGGAFMKSILLFWKKYLYLLLIAFVIGGFFDLRIGLIAITCMIGPIVASLFKGRFWCGNVCPRGSFYDNIAAKFSRKKKTPAFLKSVYFRTALAIFLIILFSTNMFKNWGNVHNMGMSVYRLIIVTTVIGIVLTLFFNHRTWCNICPMGSISALSATLRNPKNKSSLLQVDNSCISCKKCERSCPMGIAAQDYKGGALTHKDCLQCNECVYVCPKKSITYINSAFAAPISKINPDIGG